MNKKKLFWKSLNFEYALNTKWFRVRKEIVELPSGKILDNFYIVENGELVAIFAINKDGNVVLVEQYRHAIKDVTIDLPGGNIRKGEKPSEAAKRELAEETGMIAGHLEKLLTYYPDSSRTACIKHIFLASDLEKDTKKLYPQDENEDVHIIIIPLKDVLDRMKNGELKEATLHIGISAYLNQRRDYK